MKKINLLLIIVSVLTMAVMAVLFGKLPKIVFAATSPSLGTAEEYAILADTYTNTSAGTTINGSIGFTTGPAMLPGGVHPSYGPGAPYATAGADQAIALNALNTQACDFSFPIGAIDLATDITPRPDPIGVYSPGVYCIDGAASIGTAGITLSGTGTYIFRITGALTSVTDSVVRLEGGASPCDVWWTPGEATTLGDNSTFVGTNIDDAGITLGTSVNWTGRALAFGGTVTTNLTDTISVPICVAPSATLTLVKTVINNSGGTKLVSDFPLFIGATSVISGVTITLSPGDYIVSETNVAGYTASAWGGDCDATGNVTLLDSDVKVCTITNDDDAAPVNGGGSSPVVERIPPIISITKIPSPLALPGGPGLVTYTYIVSNIGTVSMRDIKVTDDKCWDPIFISGDSNNNTLLDPGEDWIFRCASQLTQTTRNIATVVGYDYGGLSATDVTSATVIVGQSITPPLIKVLKIPNPLTVPAEGGLVKYAYTVTNPGIIALSNVRITDDKCQTVTFESGDTNNNSLLDINESWIYGCEMNIMQNTVNTVTARGSANGLTAIDHAFATVLVSDSIVIVPIIPKLPNTGLGGGIF